MLVHVLGEPGVYAIETRRTGAPDTQVNDAPPEVAHNTKYPGNLMLDFSIYFQITSDSLVCELVIEG